MKKLTATVAALALGASASTALAGGLTVAPVEEEPMVVVPAASGSLSVSPLVLLGGAAGLALIAAAIANDDDSDSDH